MEEDSRFREDVEVVSKALAQAARGEEPEKECQRLYQKFKKSRREPVRLAVALRGYFMEWGVSPGQREEYREYLKARITMAMEELITEEAVDKMEAFEKAGWFDACQLEQFIRSARIRGKVSSLVWLLHLKNDKYGYQDHDFTL